MVKTSLCREVPGVTGNWREIALEDGEAVTALRQRFGSRCAALAFPNLFLWREEYELSLLMEKDLFAVRMGAAGSNDYFAPCGSDAAKAELVERLLEQNPHNLRFHYLFAEDCDFFARYFPSSFCMIETPEHSEYLLCTAEQTALSGSRFAKIRSEIRKECEVGELLIRPLGADLLTDAHTLLTRWVVHRTELGVNVASKDAAREALDAFEELGLMGAMFYRQGEAVGFNIGYPLGGGMLDGIIDICMGFSGMEFYMNHLLCSMVADRYTHLNIEEDLGIAGLRMRKQKCCPSGIMQAWRCQTV